MTGWLHDETEAHTSPPRRALSADNASTYVAILVGGAIVMLLATFGPAALAMLLATWGN
jgi:hypothetical protein